MRGLEKIRAALLCGALLIILIILVIAFRDQKKQIVVKQNKSQISSDNASVQLDNVKYSDTNKDNFKEWELRAKSAKYYKEQNIVKLENITLYLYCLDGKIYKLTADWGEFDTSTRNIKVNGNVKGILTDGTIIITDSFFYNNKKREITTKDKMLIKRDKFSMEGKGVVIDLNQEKLSLLEKVIVQGKNEN
jgi:LPS export ABC transporter protein LptC